GRPPRALRVPAGPGRLPDGRLRRARPDGPRRLHGALGQGPGRPHDHEEDLLFQEQVVGSIVCFEWDGKREVGYWIDRQHWGKGLATAALSLFLGEVAERPLYAGAARDNVASLRVLEKCGFATVGHGKAFSNARGGEIEHVLLKLGQFRAPGKRQGEGI